MCVGVLVLSTRTRPNPRGRRLAVAAAAAVVLVQPAAAGEAGGRVARQSRPQCADPLPQELTPPTVAVELSLSSTTVPRDEPLRLKVTVRNDGPLPIPHTHGGQTYDLWIRDSHGSIWLWSQGKTFTDIFVRDYLMPGEARVGRGRWKALCTTDGSGLRRGLPGPGRYVAQALWVSDVDDQDGDGDGAWWSNEVSFRIKRRSREQRL